MPESPQIKADPLLLTSFADRHLDEHYVGWLNNGTLMRFSENRHRTHSLESCSAYVKTFSGSPHYLWAIEATDENNEHIGNISAHVDINNSIADIGILLGAKSAKGKGFGFFAWKAVMNFLADENIAEKITGGCLEGNVAMIRIMEKAGMTPDGFRPNHYLVDGKRMGIVHYAWWPKSEK